MSGRKRVSWQVDRVLHGPGRTNRTGLRRRGDLADRDYSSAKAGIDGVHAAIDSQAVRAGRRALRRARRGSPVRHVVSIEESETLYVVFRHERHRCIRALPRT